MKLAHIEDQHLVFCIFLAVNKLIIKKDKNIFYLIAKRSGCIKYT